jgi:hypothetical protein
MTHRAPRVRVCLALAVAALLSLPLASQAAEVYVVRFWTDIAQVSPTLCYRVGWRDHLLFRNTADQDLSVRALSVSNGFELADPDPLVIPAHQMRSVLIVPQPGESAFRPNWIPRSQAYIFLVNRLDVPDGVVVESRGEIYGPGPHDQPLPCPISIPLGFASVLGSISLPVVRTLTPAGVEHVSLAADVGSRRQRTNVGVYNGGASPANVRMELRRSCDDVAVATRTAVIPATSVTQFTGLSDPRGSGCSREGVPEHSRYTVVLMDQPGFSFVTSLVADVPPGITITSATPR